MIKKLAGLYSHTFAKAAVWMTIGLMFANAGAFFFVILLVGLLTPKDYAIFASLVSVFNLLLVPAGILQLTIVSLVAQAKGSDQPGAVGYIYYYFVRRILLFGTATFLAFLVFSNSISRYLGITDNRLLVIVLISAVGFYFIIAGRAILQGMSAFGAFSVSNILEMVMKLTFAYGLTKLGFGLIGALISILLAEVIVAFFTLAAVHRRFISDIVVIPVAKKEMLSLILPTTGILLGLTSFYTSDILLVKHYFLDNQAALYVGVSTLGKIIFFGTTGISAALLPLSAERYAKGQRSRNLLLLSLGLVAFSGFIGTCAYYLFPDLLLKMLRKTEYLEAAPLLGGFAVFISLHSLVFLLANFLLSVKKLTCAYFILTAAACQIGGIMLFHKSLDQVIMVSTISSALLLITLLLAYVVRRE